MRYCLTYKAVLLTLVTLAAFSVLMELRGLMRDLRGTVQKANLTVENLDRTVIIVGAAAADVEKGARAWELASKTQSSQTTLAMAHFSSTVSAFGDLIQRTDASLNGQLIPTLNTSINEQNASLLASGKQLTADLAALENNSKRIDALLTDADAQIADPSIKATLGNIQGITADTHTETGLIVAQTREAFKPKNKFLAILQMLGGGAISAAEGYYYFTH